MSPRIRSHIGAEGKQWNFNARLQIWLGKAGSVTVKIYFSVNKNNPSACFQWGVVGLTIGVRRAGERSF